MCSEIHCCMSSLFWGSETSTSDAAHPQTHNTTETQRWELRNKPLTEHLSGPRQTDAHAPVYQCVPWVGPPAPASSSGLHLSSVRLCRTFLMKTYTQGQSPWMCNIKTATQIYVLSSSVLDYAFSCQLYQRTTACKMLHYHNFMVLSAVRYHKCDKNDINLHHSLLIHCFHTPMLSLYNLIKL